jgi:hypothetical protein
MFILPALDSAAPGLCRPWASAPLTPFPSPIYAPVYTYNISRLAEFEPVGFKSTYSHKQYTSKDYTETGCTNEWDCNSQLHPLA